MLSSNMVKIFKETTPHLAPYAGQGKIFEHLLCTGGRRSYDVNTLNHIFEQRIDTDNLMSRIIIMMEYLQAGYHSGEYPGPAGQYEHSKTEYPEKYKLLVLGLSDCALKVIKSVNVSKFSTSEPAHLAQSFCDQLLRDRESFLPSLQKRQEKAVISTPRMQELAV